MLLLHTAPPFLICYGGPWLAVHLPGCLPSDQVLWRAAVSVGDYTALASVLNSPLRQLLHNPSLLTVKVGSVLFANWLYNIYIYI